jgi:hypothetical protein
MEEKRERNRKERQNKNGQRRTKESRVRRNHAGASTTALTEINGRRRLCESY